MEPWRSIKPPKGLASYTARLADPENAYNFYWARNADGKYVFRFLGNFPEDYFDDAPNMRASPRLSEPKMTVNILRLFLKTRKMPGFFPIFVKAFWKLQQLFPEAMIRQRQK